MKSIRYLLWMLPLEPLPVKPAYAALHNLGFTKLKVLYIPDNLETDWVNEGYPVEKGA